MKTINWKGVFPAITTKFKADDTLDLKLLLKNIYAQLEAGVHGLILGGSLGEASTIKAEEKDYLMSYSLGYIKNKVPVLMNIAEPITANAVDAAKRAQTCGADGLMLLPPMRYRADNRETLEFFKSVARETDLPIMIYNNPVDYGIEVTTDMFEELLKLNNIQAVKESTRDVTNITRLRNAFGDDLKILCGVDTLALESLLLGADGWVSGLVCAFPRETVVIYELAKQGRTEEAREIYRWYMPLLELDIHPKLVQYIKLAETFTKLGSEYVRPPRLPLVGEERERVVQIIQHALNNRPVLPTV